MTAGGRKVLGTAAVLILAAAAGWELQGRPKDPYAEIEREIASSDQAIRSAQAELSDRATLSDYSARVRQVGGDEDWSDALQSALAEHEIVVIPPRTKPYGIGRTVTIPSSRRIEANGATIALLPGVTTVMLRNAGVRDGTLKPVRGDRDRDIAIVGGRWQDCATKRAGYGDSGRFNLAKREVGNFYGVSTLMLFSNVDRVMIENATFAKCSAFAVQSAEGDGRLFRNIRFDDCFADGLHLNGNLTRVHAVGIRGKVGDDLVALNAYDWLNSSINFGPQRHVICEDLELVLKDGDGYPAIRILPAVYRYADGSKVDCAINSMIFRRVKGITTFKMYLQTPAYRIGSEPEWSEIGSGGDLYFEDVTIDLRNPIDMLGGYRTSDPLRGHYGAFEFGANLSAVTIRNVDVRFNLEQYPMGHLAVFGPKSSVVGETEYFDPYVSCRVGQVTVSGLVIRGKEPEEIVRVTAFDDINHDGRSTGRGGIGKLTIKR